MSILRKKGFELSDIPLLLMASFFLHAHGTVSQLRWIHALVSKGEVFRSTSLLFPTELNAASKRLFLLGATLSLYYFTSGSICNWFVADMAKICRWGWGQKAICALYLFFLSIFQPQGSVSLLPCLPRLPLINILFLIY